MDNNLIAFFVFFLFSFLLGWISQRIIQIFRIRKDLERLSNLPDVQVFSTVDDLARHIEGQNVEEDKS